MHPFPNLQQHMFQLHGHNSALGAPEGVEGMPQAVTHPMSSATPLAHPERMAIIQALMEHGKTLGGHLKALTK